PSLYSFSSLSLHDALPISSLGLRDCNDLPHLFLREYGNGERYSPGCGGSAAIHELRRNGIADSRNLLRTADENLSTAAQKSFFVDRKSTRLNSSHVSISYA